MNLRCSLLLAATPSLAVLLAMPALSPAMGASPHSESPVRFADQIRPLLNKHCTACHGGVKQAGGVSFLYRNKALAEGDSGNPTVVPGKPEESELVYRITTDDPDDRMPPPDDHPDGLSPEESELLQRWVREGAPWDEHWAFVPPQRPEIPAVASTDWPRAELDAFVLARLDAVGLTPAPDASPAEWLRRVSLDLVGLPPSPDELDAFEEAVAHEGDAAFPPVVDRLLASPHFGERWAALWLDLARYADTQGYEKDLHRDAWPFRDWLINAFNRDLPFDQFTIEQLAGDQLADPTPDQLVATAFHRNTQTNTEGGTDDEEFRVAAVIDRVNTTWTVWQGVTFGCVQCHSHPYDPIEHSDYYRFLTYFNQTADCDLGESGDGPVDDFPRFDLPLNPSDDAKALALDREIGSLRRTLNDGGRALAGATAGAWTGLVPASVTTSHGALEFDSARGRFDASGTLAIQTRYDLEFPAAPMTALRVEIFPSVDDPAKMPETGAVLSHFEGSLRRADGTTVPIRFSRVYADSLAGPFDPGASLDGKSRDGFGAYPKLFGRRWAVFVLESPLGEAEAEGATLVLGLGHAATIPGQTALVLRHFAVSATSSTAWTHLATAPETVGRSEQLNAAIGERNALGTRARLPVMAERPDDARRPDRLFIRGNFLDKGEAVTAGVPATFSPPPPGTAPDRLAMARWLVSRDNPLTARVAANRFWGALFGTGIVRTQEDFGSTGSPPTHPQLLDHLAIRFRDELGWSIKGLLREIALSSTYRQTSAADAAKRAADPDNVLLSRGPRKRLGAEMVRDHALSAAGLLSGKMFGPPVMPPQPDGVWQVVYSGAQWKTSEGEDRHRRGIYTYWRRTSPYPSFLVFDAPTRDACVARREPTNTPLHALVTLNDPVYLEAAHGLAGRMRSEGGQDPVDLDAALAHGYRIATSRHADDGVVASLRALHDDALAALSNEPGESAKLAPTTREAALVIVANALLNLDLALTR